MTGLLLPRHVHEKAVADSLAQRAGGARVVHRLDSDDFLTASKTQEQLDMLHEYVDARREVEPGWRLPAPLGWRLQVLMLTIPEQTEGGIHVVEHAREQRSIASPQGIVLQVGPACYSDPRRFDMDGKGLQPWVRVGDRITFTKYDAAMFQLANGQRLGYLTDTQPLSTIDSGWEVPK